MVGGLLFSILLIGVVQGKVVPLANSNEPTIIEDLRQGSRVVGGWPAAPAQIPHQVSVRMVAADGGVSSCGGSLIEHSWVLTAAHCAANRLTFVVRLGVTNLARPELLTETTKKYIHPNYVELVAGVQTDDIALLQLEYSIPYGPLVQPVRLMSSYQKNVDFTGVVFTVSGFGRTDDLWNGGDVSEDLLWTHLRGISNAECRAWYGGSSVIQEQTICAEYYNDTAQSSCQGDSGGPLTFVDADGRRTQAGLVSFGSSAGCNSVYPSAYVRPGHYHEWIRGVTGVDFDWRPSHLETSSEETAAGSSEIPDAGLKVIIVEA